MTERPRVRLLVLSVIGVAILALACPAVAPATTAQGPGVDTRLDAFLDDSVYVVDQPIMLLFRLQSLSRSHAVAVPPMRRLDGFVRVILSRNGRVLPPTFHYSDEEEPKTNERLQLSAGGVQIEMANLLFQFGEPRIRGHEPVAGSFSQRRLSPGEYSVAVEMAWPGQPPGPASTVLRSPVLSFSIVPLSMFPADSLLLDRLVADCDFPDLPAYVTKDGQRIRNCCRDHLSQFLHSKFLTLVYYAAGLPDPGLPTDSLMESLRSAGVGPVRQGAILWRECKLSKRSGADRLHWLESAAGLWRPGLNEQVLRTWRDRHIQKKFDPARED